MKSILRRPTRIGETRLTRRGRGDRAIMGEPNTVVVAPALRADKLLSIDQVGERLGVDRRTVRAATIKQGVRFVRVARLLRFRASWVEEFIDKAGRRPNICHKFPQAT